MTLRSRLSATRFSATCWAAISCVAIGSFGLACSPFGQQPDVRGAVGVFYGGQVQEVQRALLSSSSPKTLGFRLELSERFAEREHHVVWEVVRPGPLGRRVTESAETRLLAGRTTFDQTIDVPHGGPFGTYNVRVLLDEVTVVDRAMLLEVGD